MQLDDSYLVRPRRSAAAGLLVSAVAIAAAACGTSSPSTSGSAASPSPHMSEHMAAGHAMTIGTDCGMIPAAGMGSVHGMASEPAATAASHNPLLTTFAAEVQKARLTGTLNSASAITVFAPDNQAFRKVTAHDMKMMSSPAELAKVIKYHVVRGKITPADFSHSMTLTTLEGGQLKAAKMGSTYEINSAAITCGNLHAGNATIYIINMVLTPMH